MTLERAPDTPAPLTNEDLAKVAAMVFALMQGGTPIDPDLRLYTAAQAAELLGRSKWWVEEQTRKGTIPFTRVGKFARFSAAQIREIRAANEVDPGTRRRRPRAVKKTEQKPAA
jgi:excisionase family DNA binding protein